MKYMIDRFISEDCGDLTPYEIGDVKVDANSGTFPAGTSDLDVPGRTDVLDDLSDKALVPDSESSKSEVKDYDGEPEEPLIKTAGTNEGKEWTKEELAKYWG